jgi:hypothetical protein
MTESIDCQHVPGAGGDGVDAASTRLAALAIEGQKMRIVVVTERDDLAECRRELMCDKLTAVAFDCEGVDLCREGLMCLVQVATKQTCYLFDVAHVRNRASPMVRLLKSVLESDKICKIIHDCKMDGDSLFHQLGIRLANVHDTQVWDGVITKATPRNLNKTLAAYDCTTNVERDSSVYKTNPAFWAMRPMTQWMIEWASQDVQVLFDLRREQVAAVAAGPNPAAVVKECMRRSVQALAVADCVTAKLRLQQSKIGLFIGTGGSNMNRLIAKHQSRGCILQFLKSAGNGVLVVYATDHAGLQVIAEDLAAFQ